MLNQFTFWILCGVLSCFSTLLCLSQSHFFKLQFENTKSWLAYFFVLVLMFAACVFLFIPKKIQKINKNISNHCPGWLVKALIEFCVLLFVTLVVVLSKYPRFKVFHEQDRSISDIRAYCQKSNYPDRDIKTICSSLLEEQITGGEQGDRMGFYSAVGFSIFTFSVSRQLKLPNEYGLFYMGLDLMMNSAVDIPVSGGSILHWKFVLISISFCFGSIFLRGFLGSFDEIESGAGGGNEDSSITGDEHEVETGIVPLLRRTRQQTDIESGAGGGNEESSRGDDHDEEMRQRHQADIESGAGGGNEESSITGDEHQVEIGIVPLLRRRQQTDIENGVAGGGREQSGIGDDHNEEGGEQQAEMAEGETGAEYKENVNRSDVFDEGLMKRNRLHLSIANRLHASDEGLRKRNRQPIPNPPSYSQIMEALKDDTVNMIGLYGMGGVGKTTLVKELGGKAKEMKLFDEVVMVVVSLYPNVKQIQDQIAELLDLKFDEKTKSARASRLKLRLKSENKILIILDDVWDYLDLADIGIPFGNDQRGCKILLTTRRQHVCTSMQSQKVIKLDVLSEYEAWVLFKKTADLGDDSSTLTNVAMEIARECKGLPLAIVQVGRALRGKSLDEWVVGLKQLKNNVSKPFL